MKMSNDSNGLPDRPPPPPPAESEPIEEVPEEETDPQGEERRRQRQSNPGRVLSDKATGLGVEIIDRATVAQRRSMDLLDYSRPVSRRSPSPQPFAAIRSGPAVATRGR